MRGSYVLMTFEWMSGRLRLMAGHHRQDYLLEYLMSLASHEDKLTCLKVDIWLSLLTYEMVAMDTRRHI